MNKLVVGNLVHRPLRSVISAFAVAIEVVMILSIAAIMLGMLNGTAKNQSGIGADMITHPGAASNLIGMSGASASIKVAGILAALPHVTVAAPVYIKLTASSSVENIYGIDFPTFDALKPFVFVAGGPFTGSNDIIIDDIQAAKGLKVGDTIQVLGQPFRICGVVEHGKGGRKFIPITTMGIIDGNEGKASAFYLLTDNSPQFQKVVRDEIHATPGMQQYDVQTMEELLSLLTPEKMPGFNIGLRTVIGIAVIIGFLVIFQSMYTAVIERTREIGILKSMGASRLYIVGIVLSETGLLTLVGIAIGIIATFALRAALHAKFPTQAFTITPGWVASGSLIAFFGALLGAFYPALKAARKDPIDALSYE
ncbi:ABC transporter permease [Granulicella arctica]|uniref:ABC transporter permease n=1 Tax=Granulicella arctica TaxID=940613 RepID=UPI0021DFCCF3|nr:FtsX-like permease family protein [Granulicella arctica]